MKIKNILTNVSCVLLGVLISFLGSRTLFPNERPVRISASERLFDLGNNKETFPTNVSNRTRIISSAKIQKKHEVLPHTQKMVLATNDLPVKSETYSKEELMKIEEECLWKIQGELLEAAVNQNSEPWKETLDQNFALSGGDCGICLKKDFIKLIEVKNPNAHLLSLDENSIIRVHDTTAVSTAYIDIEEPVNEQPQKRRVLMTNVWRKRSEGWKIIHMTLVNAPKDGE